MTHNRHPLANDHMTDGVKLNKTQRVLWSLLDYEERTELLLIGLPYGDSIAEITAMVDLLALRLRGQSLESLKDSLTA